MIRSGMLLALILFAAAPATIYAANLTVGEPVPQASIEKDGMLVPEYDVVEGKMVYKEGTAIGYHPWSTDELKGKIRTVYHLASRLGMDNINKDYIDGIIAAKLDEKLPDSLYKTTTVLNLNDALWGTSSLAHSRMESSQKEFAYAEYVMDANGDLAAAWGLEPKNSAIIVVDADGKVLWFKEGKLTPEDIDEAVTLIKTKVAELAAKNKPAE